MSVSEKEIDRIASLAKLEFNAEAKKEIQSDMNNMIEFINKLDEINTDNVEPLLFITEEVNVLREDDVKSTITQKEALKNAPQKDSDYFKIPKVISQD